MSLRSTRVAAIRRASMLTLLVLAASQLVPSPAPAAAAEPAHDFRVQVGAISPEVESLPYEYTRFYPDHLRVHRGQTVQFDSLNFHTVTFHPGGDDVRMPLMRPDEGASGFALNEPAWQRSGCGTPPSRPASSTTPTTACRPGSPCGTSRGG